MIAYLDLDIWSPITPTQAMSRAPYPQSPGPHQSQYMQPPKQVMMMMMMMLMMNITSPNKMMMMTMTALMTMTKADETRAI